jgi:hypothetical protein
MTGWDYSPFGASLAGGGAEKRQEEMWAFVKSWRHERNVSRVCLWKSLCGACVVKCGDAVGGGEGKKGGVATKLQKSATATTVLTFRNTVPR